MKLRLILIVSVLAMQNCQIIPALAPNSTPLPSLNSSIGALLVEDNAFPEGWVRIRDLPKDMMTDPTVNHVYRSWWGKAKGEGEAEQAVWRLHTIAEAEDQYSELREHQFYPNRTLPTYEVFVEFEPPDEIDFQSQMADEFYLACGWWTWAYCQVVARYRNYVTYMKLDQEAEYKGQVTHGLTYPEIETIVRAMDANISELLEISSNSSP